MKRAFPVIRFWQSKKSRLLLTVLLLANIASSRKASRGGCGPPPAPDVTFTPGRVEVRPDKLSETVIASIGRPANWSIDPTQVGWFEVLCKPKVEPECEVRGVDSIEIQIKGAAPQTFPENARRSIRVTAVPVEEDGSLRNPLSDPLSVRGLRPKVVLIQRGGSPHEDGQGPAVLTWSVPLFFSPGSHSPDWAWLVGTSDLSRRGHRLVTALPLPDRRELPHRDCDLFKRCSSGQIRF